MQIQAVDKEMVIGEPVCAAAGTTVCESVIHLVRSLHTQPTWTEVISQHIIQLLDNVKDSDLLNVNPVDKEKQPLEKEMGMMIVITISRFTTGQIFDRLYCMERDYISFS